MMPIAPSYQHRSKSSLARQPLIIGRTYLKWYDLDEPDLRISGHTRISAMSAAQPIPDPSDLAGFVILHRCSTEFHFLLINVWRGNNEIWQSVYYIDAQTPEFTPFQSAYPPFGALRPTFCVWEMGIVAHESQAWQRYLFSDRSRPAMEIWQNDLLTGTV